MTLLSFRRGCASATTPCKMPRAKKYRLVMLSLGLATTFVATVKLPSPVSAQPQSTSPFSLTKLSLGQTPSGVAVDQATSTAYVTDVSPPSIQVIDESTDSVTGLVSIPVTNSAHLQGGIAFDQLLGLLVVGTNYGTLFFVDTSTLQLAGSLQTNCNAIVSIALDPSTGLALAMGGNGGVACVVDLNTESLIKTILVGEYADSAVFDPVNNTFYAGTSGGTIAEIPEDFWSVVATLYLNRGVSVQTLALDPSTQILYAVSSGGHVVSYFAPPSGVQKGTIKTGEYVYNGTVDDPLDGSLIIANEDGTLSLVDTVSETLSGTLTAGSDTTNSPAAMAFDDNLDLALATNAGDNTLVFLKGTSTRVLSQSISFTSVPPSDAQVNGPVYTASATSGGSGNPIIFGSATPTICSISGSTISFVGVGTCTVVANQAGNSHYQQAAAVSQSVLVSPATLKITTAPRLPSGANHRRYFRRLSAAGGVGLYQWKLLGREHLPKGLTLSNGGVISGIPVVKQSTTLHLHIVVTDSASPQPNRADRLFTLLVHFT